MRTANASATLLGATAPRGRRPARYLADILSACNLGCGVLVMVMTVLGRMDLALLFLAAGVAFDGVDGLAARRFGGSRMGVLADDIADGVTNGIAPGFVLAWTVGGGVGILMGLLYAAFVIGRLLFFTLDKAEADPAWFSGAPSTVGAFTIVSASALFAAQPALLGLIAGIACFQMVSFDTRYKHLGRAAKRHPALLGLGLLHLAVCVVGYAVGGVVVPAAIVLVTNLLYGFAPTAGHMARVMLSQRV